MFFLNGCKYRLLGYCPDKKRINLPVSGGKQTEPRFPQGLCMCLAPFSFYPEKLPSPEQLQVYP